MVSSVERSVNRSRTYCLSVRHFRIEIGGINKRSPQPGDFITHIVEQNKEVAEERLPPCQCPHQRVGEHGWKPVFTMVQNVLSNAFKYAREAGYLSARAGRTAAWPCRFAIPDQASNRSRPRRFSAGSIGFPTTMRLLSKAWAGSAIVRGLGELLELEVSLYSVPGRGTSVVISGLVVATSCERPAQANESHRFQASGSA